MVGIHIFTAIPLLNNPVLERHLGLTFTRCRRCCCRTRNGLRLIRIQVWIRRCIITYYCIAIVVFSCCCISNFNTGSTFQYPSPGGIQIDNTNCSRIVDGIISGVCAIQGIKLPILPHNGIIQGKGSEVPDFRKALIGKPSDQVIHITGAAHITNPVTIVDIECISTCTILSNRVTINICKGWIIILIRMKIDLIFL